MAGIHDPGSAEGSSNTIQSVAVITPEDPVFRLDTYDVAEAFDADEDQHANMPLELRWLDEDKARNQDPPTTISPDFGTVWGVFPSQPLAFDLSIFHPEENGEGFDYAVAHVDEAAKNEATNGMRTTWPSPRRTTCPTPSA